MGEEGDTWCQAPDISFISSSGSTSDLRALFDFVRVSLTPADGDSWKAPVLLVDDLSVLLSLGAAPVAVLDFIHYCRVSVCCQLKVLLPVGSGCAQRLQSKAWLYFLFPPDLDEVFGRLWLSSEFRSLLWGHSLELCGSLSICAGSCSAGFLGDAAQRRVLCVSYV